MPRYILVKWKHKLQEEPVELYSELSDDGMERRKVEVFADGSRGFADETRAFGTTILGELPVPALEDIAQDPQFEPHEIDKQQFEREWKKAVDESGVSV